MKRSFNMIRSLAVILLAAVLFSACKKDAYTAPGSNNVAGLMAFNLAPDKDAIGFSLSGNNFGNILGYTDYSGAYLPIYTGTRDVKAFDYFSGTTIVTTTGDFRDSMYYSAFLVGANGNYKNIVVNDELNPITPVAGKAWVRFINAIPDSSATVNITVAGDAPTNAPYGTISSFKQVDAGAVNSSVSNGGNISASRSITMEENKVYTLLFVGLPNATDSTKKVQVKYIVNGIATQ